MSIDWHERARMYAREAHERHFSTRWGTWLLCDASLTVVFSNHFYAEDPTLQDRERAYMRRRFREEAIGVLGEATWPIDGPDDGFSYAILLDAPKERKELVKAIQEAAIGLSLETF